MTIKRVENNAYEIKHRKVDVEVGDRKNPGFRPNLKLKRWYDECSLDIAFADDVEEAEMEEETDVEGDITKIKCKVKIPTTELDLEYYPLEPRVETIIVNGKEHKFHQLDDGGLGFDIILTKKPLVNTFTLSINTKGLKFFYQPPLHLDHPTWVNKRNPDDQDEGNANCFMPENVVGSYAVYHATRTNMHRNKEDAEKYKCGKAFHIYRPKVVDDVGSETWADINIKNDVMTITVPQHFLDDAVYPVRVDPDFGFTGIGEAEAGLPSDILLGAAYASPAVAGMRGVSMSLYCYSSAHPENIKMGLWVNADGGALIANGLTGVGVAGEFYGWVSANFVAAPDIAASTTHLLGFVDEDGNLNYKFDWDAGMYHADWDNSYAAPGNFDWDDTAEIKISIYCTYEVAPPPPVPANPLIGKPLISHDIIKKVIIR